MADLSFASNGKTLTLEGQSGLLHDAGDVPIYTGDKTGVCIGTQYRDSTGALQEGTKPCASPVICSAEVSDNCVAQAPFKGINANLIVAGDLTKGVVIAGITGTYPSEIAP